MPHGGGHLMGRSPRITVAASGLGHVARGVEAWAHDLAGASPSAVYRSRFARGAGGPTGPLSVLPCWQREAPNNRLLRRLLPRRMAGASGSDPRTTSNKSRSPAICSATSAAIESTCSTSRTRSLRLLTQRAAAVGLVRTRTILAHGTEEPISFQKKVRYLQHLAPWHRNEARHAGIDRPTWTAIPNCIDTDLFTPGVAPELRAELGLPANALVVLCVAAIKRIHKRVDYLISEFARLCETAPELPAYLVVAGGWEPEADELVAEGKRRLGDRVRFLVRFPPSRMPDLYRAANLFVLGSLFEMMPMAILESAATAATGRGAPASRPGVDDRRRRRVPSIWPSRARWPRALERLLSNWDLLQRTGQRAREHCIRQLLA